MSVSNMLISEVVKCASFRQESVNCVVLQYCVLSMRGSR